MLGDGESASLLEDLAQQEAPLNAREDQTDDAGLNNGEEDSPAILLFRAKAPLERLAEFCEAVVDRPSSEALLQAAQAVLETTIARMSRLSLRGEHLD